MVIIMLIVTVLTIFFTDNFQPPQHPRPLVAFTKYSNRRKPATNERPHSITIKYCSKKTKNYLTIGTKYVKAVSHQHFSVNFLAIIFTINTNILE